MDEMDRTTGSFRWVLIPSSAVFLVLAIQQTYVVMTHTPKMLNILAGFGADLSAATLFAARWYWVGCVVTAGLTAVATSVVFVKARSSEYRTLKLWYLAAVAGVVGTLLWSAFVTSAMYDPIFKLGSAI